MAIESLNPYLFFNGNAAAAIAFYESALGARPDGVMHWGDVPGMDVPPGHEKRVMHSQLFLGKGIVMVSDGGPGEDVPFGRNVRITLNYTDVAEMTERFDALAQGGEITMPLADTFWGATFGMLTDKFGVAWMFNCDKKEA
jgi:PhnB protein